MPRFKQQLALRPSQAEKWDADLQYHNTLFDAESFASNGRNRLQASISRADLIFKSVEAEEIRTSPLFTASVLKRVSTADKDVSETLLPQYGLLAKILEDYDAHGSQSRQISLKVPLKTGDSNSGKEASDESDVDGSSLAIHKADPRLFLNINAPWSAFVCGSQGSGKSHTLSCMLESALQPSQLGPLVAPLIGMVFHYDKFTGHSSSQICEAAYLCSRGIPVKVLVSPTSLSRMKKVYENLPGIPKGEGPVVMPLFLQERQLNVERMLKLMAIDDDGRTALYMEVVCRILRSMAIRNPDKPGIDYQEFKRRLELENFNPAQMAMVNMRLSLLESFMYWPDASNSVHDQFKPQFATSVKGKLKERDWEDKQDRKSRAKLGSSTIWSFDTGSLTIIDLSCPFIDESSACALFNICLALFLEERADTGRIIALDEAHKFMTGSAAGNVFTESLLSVIRQQRHLAARVIIATQEPTISPALLDLSSMTIVHRFTSPEWLRALSSHLAGAGGAIEGEESGKRELQRILERIVTLDAGQALLFSPSAMVTSESESESGADSEGKTEGTGMKIRKLGLRYVKIRVRKRLTADGGRSILAT